MSNIIICPYSDFVWVHLPKIISAKIPTPQTSFTYVDGMKTLRLPINITRVVGFPAYLWYNDKYVLVYAEKKHRGRFSSNVGFLDLRMGMKLKAYLSKKPIGEYIEV